MFSLLTQVLLTPLFVAPFPAARTNGHSQAPNNDDAPALATGHTPVVTVSPSSITPAVPVDPALVTWLRNLGADDITVDKVRNADLKTFFTFLYSEF